MIDIHSHYLPDWDDGPRAWDDTLRMCEKSRADGVTDVIVTPHLFRATLHGDDLALLAGRFEEFEERTRACGLRFHRGAEVFLTHEVVEFVRAHAEARLAGGRYVLLEFPVSSIPPQAREISYQLQLAGIIPVLAHPERNTAFQQNPALLYNFVLAGALTQITAQSLTGRFGSEAAEAARLFLEHRWIHAIACDAHGPDRREPILSKGRMAAAEIVGEEEAEALVQTNTCAILKGEPLTDAPEPIPVEEPRGLRIRIPAFLRRLIGGGGSDES